MTKRQFRVLYRQFLFRMVDLEILSSHAQGDANRLLGQCATLLIFLSWVQAIGSMLFDGIRMTPLQRLISLWSKEHSLTAMTMVAVGMFAVLSWDSMFPDRRDVLVLAPLPVRVRTLFRAKLAALAVALGLTVAALNAFSSISWALRFARDGAGILGGLRAFGAYWISMLASGAFIFCLVLTVQGLAAQLPRRMFLRLSAFLQMVAFAVFLAVYLMEPGEVTPRLLSDPRHQQLLAWVPTYWYFALFHALNGTLTPAMVPLFRHAAAGLAIVIFGAFTAFLLSYVRTVRRVVEEPDILPGHHGLRWLPPFGSALETAIAQFSIRTLLRSRQHRVVLAFYLGIGFAIVSIYLQSMLVQQQLAKRQILPVLVATILVMCFSIVGTRVVMAMPLDLRANWVFRVSAVQSAPKCLGASRRALLALSAVPVWAGSAVLLFALWPWRLSAAHIGVLVAIGLLVAECCLYGFYKIPFTCSYLPGKGHLHLAFLAGWGLLLMITFFVQIERDALPNTAAYVRMLLILAGAVAVARWITRAAARDEEVSIRFEEAPVPAVQVLGLTRDGVTLLP